MLEYHAGLAIVGDKLLQGKISKGSSSRPDGDNNLWSPLQVRRILLNNLATTANIL